MTQEWKPAIGEQFIWKNQATLTCTDRILHPTTGKRCLTGRNTTGSGYLDGQLLDFEQCRQHWEPQPGDRVQQAVNWFAPHYQQGQQGKCIGYITDNDGLRLSRIQFGTLQRWDCQPIWLLPIGGDP